MNAQEQNLYDMINLHKEYAFSQSRSYRSYLCDEEFLKKNLLIEMDYKAKYYFGKL